MATLLPSEILDQIFDEIDCRADRAVTDAYGHSSLPLVCRSWRASGTRHLFRVIEPHSARSIRLLIRIFTNDAKLGALVESIYCPTFLRIYHKKKPPTIQYSRVGEDVNGIFTVSFPSVTALTIDELDSLSYRFYDLITFCPNLKVLFAPLLRYSSTSPQFEAFPSFHKLEALTLLGLYDGRARASGGFKFTPFALNSWKGLAGSILDQPRDQIGSSRFPNLRRLRFVYTLEDTILHFLQSPMPPLTHLYLVDGSLPARTFCKLIDRYPESLDFVHYGHGNEPGASQVTSQKLYKGYDHFASVGLSLQHYSLGEPPRMFDIGDPNGRTKHMTICTGDDLYFDTYSVLEELLEPESSHLPSSIETLQLVINGVYSTSNITIDHLPKRPDLSVQRFPKLREIKLVLHRYRDRIKDFGISDDELLSYEQGYSKYFREMGVRFIVENIWREYPYAVHLFISQPINRHGIVLSDFNSLAQMKQNDRWREAVPEDSWVRRSLVKLISR